jgi:rare lipoprotein A
MKMSFASVLVLVLAHGSLFASLGPVKTGTLSEEGVARYYAANLKGKITAHGEKYDESQLTASHSKLPLNTLVKVTNLENNKSVEVRINDHCRCEEEGKIINLSREAASKLGMIASGVAKVRIEVVTPPESGVASTREINTKEEKEKEAANVGMGSAKTSPATGGTLESNLEINKSYNSTWQEQHPKGFGVQVTSLTNLKMLQDICDELIKLGVKKEEIYIQVGQKETQKVFRLMFGTFYTKEGANERLAWLSEQGYKGVIRSHLNN